MAHHIHKTWRTTITKNERIQQHEQITSVAWQESPRTQRYFWLSLGSAKGQGENQNKFSACFLLFLLLLKQRHVHVCLLPAMSNRVGRPKGGPVWGSTFRIVPPVNGQLWWGENYSNINDPACPKAEASEMVQAGSFLFLFYICIFVCTLMCICVVICTRTLIQFLWRKTIAKPFLCRCLATWRPIILKWFCLLERENYQKVPFVSASENSILMEEAKWTNAERIKKENYSWWECRITHTT